MPLAYDSEYAKALEPMPILAPRPTPKVHDVGTRRRQLDSNVEASLGPVPVPSNVSIDTLKVPSYDQAEITVLRVYPKKAAEASPTASAAFIHVHGGGFISGSAQTFVKATALTASATKLQFFTVDYRKAPEHPHPTPAEDVYAALKWVQDNAARFGVDPARIGITGESSGGGIAASVAIMARDRKLSPPLAKQVLVYPMLDDRNLSPVDGVEELAVWKCADNVTGWTALLGDQAGKANTSPYAAAARVASVEGLPPLYIDVGELDMFREEAMEYALRFVKASISTEFHLYPGLPHGWEAYAPFISTTQRAIGNRHRALTSM
uniref:Arylesterase/monoxygenase n=1 Tax=Nodulisporium sp. TaxID=1897413 RepID=A0A2R4QF52_9PEZI|nr:arylesterase/monoxygenase [Nodulisporium sp.]